MTTTEALWEAFLALGYQLTLKCASTGEYERVSPLMGQWLGWAEHAQPIGMTDVGLVDPVTAQQIRAIETSFLSPSRPQLTTEHIIAVRGERMKYRCLRMWIEQTGDEPRILSIWEDQQKQQDKDAQLRSALQQVEQLQEAFRRLQMDHEQLEQALTSDQERDSFAHLQIQMRREIDLSTREQREFSLVVMTLDATPNVKKNLRQLYGEALFRLLKKNTRAMDTFCTLSDDEFAVLLSGVGLTTSHHRMEELRRQCANSLVVHEGQESHFSVSMGIASFPHTAEQDDELLKRARLACEVAQQRGGNRVVLAPIDFSSPRP